MNANNEKNDFALVPRTPGAIEKAEPGTKRVLSGMVTDALALVKKESRPKPRIVLVNDDAGLLQMMESLICDAFKEVVVLQFQNGEQAWQELQRQDPDILVTDMQRPDDSMDGWAMIPLLADKKVKYPVVIVSACSEFSTQNDLETSGAVPDKFLEAVEAEHAKFRSLLINARQSLNITNLVAPYESEMLLNILATCLKNRDTDITRLGKTAAQFQPSPGLCPMCGGRVYETDSGFACERSQHCKFRILKTILDQPLDRAQMEKLLQTGKTDLLDNFISKDGKQFAAYLVIDNGKIVFEFPPNE
jgi:CheY-like chemotaxis protein